MQVTRQDGGKGSVTRFTAKKVMDALADPETKRIVIAKLPDRGVIVDLNGVRFVVDRWRDNHKAGITLMMRAIELIGEEKADETASGG